MLHEFFARHLQHSAATTAPLGTHPQPWETSSQCYTRIHRESTITTSPLNSIVAFAPTPRANAFVSPPGQCIGNHGTKYR